jgi:hypothetical protein
LRFDGFGFMFRITFMNTKEIEEELKEKALKLKNGDDAQKAFCRQIAEIAARMEPHRKANERPIQAEDVQGIISGTSKFQPPYLAPHDKRMNVTPYMAAR